MTAPDVRAPAQGDPRARRPRRGRRSAAHRDRRASPTSTSSSARAPTRCCCSRCCTRCFAEGLARPGRLAALIDGLDAARALRSRRSRPSASRRAPASPPTHPRGSRATFAAAPRAVGYGRVGVSHAGVRRRSRRWLINVLNVVTGNLDRAGGADVHAAGGRPRCGSRGARAARARSARWRSRVRGLPEFGGELPVAALAEEIETAGRRARSARWSRSPATRCCRRPTGARLERALAALDFMVVDRSLHQRDHAPRARDPAARRRPLEHDALRPRSSTLLAVRNTAQVLAAAVRAARRTRATTGRSSSSCSARLGTRRRRGAGRSRARAPRSAQLGPEALHRPRRCAPARYGSVARAAALAARSSSGPARHRPRPARAAPARTAARRPTARSHLAPAGARRRPRSALEARARAAPRADGELAAHRPPPPAQQQLVDAQQPAPGEGPGALHAADAPRRRARRAASPTAQRVARPLAGRRDRGAARGHRRGDARRGEPAARLGPRAPGRAAARGRSARRGRASTTSPTSARRRAPRQRRPSAARRYASLQAEPHASNGCQNASAGGAGASGASSRQASASAVSAGSRVSMSLRLRGSRNRVARQGGGLPASSTRARGSPISTRSVRFTGQLPSRREIASQRSRDNAVSV